MGKVDISIKMIIGISQTMLGLYRLAMLYRVQRVSEYVTWESAILVSIEMEGRKWVSATPRFLLTATA